MVGDVIGGYVVKESLGSGRVGLLYLAMHPETGHRAVVRRRLNDADSADEFGAEAAQVLSLQALPRVERRTSRSGAKVLLAIIDETAPGFGRTEYANTQLLPDLHRRTRLLPLLWLIPLLALGVALGSWRVMRTESGVEALPAEPSTAEPPPPPVLGAPKPVEDVVAAVATSKKVIRTAAQTCEPDEGWKRNARGNLSELMNRSAPHEALTTWTSGEGDSIGRAIERAFTPAQCGAVEARLNAFHLRVLTAEKP